MRNYFITLVLVCLTISFSSFGQSLDEIVEGKTKEIKKVVTEKTPLVVKEKVVKVSKNTKQVIEKKLITKQVIKPKRPYTYEDDEWKVSVFPSIIVNGGLVLSSDEGSDKAQETGFALGMYANFIDKKINHSFVKKINLMSVGFNMQGSGKVNPVLSPVNITFQNRVNVGVSFMPQNNKTKGGNAILTLGFDF